MDNLGTILSDEDRRTISQAEDKAAAEQVGREIYFRIQEGTSVNEYEEVTTAARTEIDNLIGEVFGE